MGSWFYGKDSLMKTTVEVPDDLYRRAKSLAAMRGRKIKDLIEEGLRLVVEGPQGSARRNKLSQLMKRARGVINSGVPDLGSNPRHLDGFGSHVRNR
jgi:hypothetical protein